MLGPTTARANDGTVSMIEDRQAQFTILIVCTANQCRSPLAEFLLAAALRDRSPGSEWNVGSAGVRVRPGLPMDPFSERALAEYGIDGSGFRRRQLDAQLVREADLVLTAARGHRSQVVQLEPRALHRAFTLNQFGYLLAGAARHGQTEPVAEGTLLIRRAAGARGLVPARPEEDDLPDPVGRPFPAFQECARRIAATVATVRDALPPLRSN
jgi:protein-tyrosine phosphatase